MSQPRFKPYPAYKDSGVEWLKEIPAHWTCLALSRVTLSRCDGPFGSGLKTEHYARSGVRVIRLQNIGSSEFIDADGAYVDEQYARDLGDHRVIGGDLLIAGLGDERHPVGRACVAPAGIEPAMVKADCFRFRLLESRVVPTFAAYQLSVTATAAAGSLATGATRSRMNLGTTASLKLAVPVVEEQHTIATFLDRETARIDTLVAKKERLIELLQEKRTGIITRAVTKGLDPNVPMKDSGVEWLGEIPAHWEVVKWRHCCHVTEGQVSPNDERFRDRVMIAPNHIESGTGKILFTKTADDQGAISGKYIVKPGDIIYSKIRPGLSKVCIATGDWLCSADMYPVAITNENLVARYLLYFMLSEPFTRLMVDESMRVAMPKVNREKLAACPLVIPGTEEQRAMSSFLDHETTRIDALIGKVSKAVERLGELRTALIAASVTGKIDVREVVA